MTRLERLSEARDVETLDRFVLDFYETKRMTSNIRERLQRIDKERDRLLQGDANYEPGGRRFESCRAHQSFQ